MLLVVLGAVVAAWLVACAFLFVWPPQDSPRHSDAIVVLAGGKQQRLSKALELVRAGVSRTLVISDGRDPHWPEANRLCAGAAHFRVVCFKPDPYSTHGEAQAIGRLGGRRGWDSVVVVTSRYHAIRARMLFRRCFGGDLRVVGVDPESPGGLPSLRNVVREWGGFAHAFVVERGC